MMENGINEGVEKLEKISYEQEFKYSRTLEQ